MPVRSQVIATLALLGLSTALARGQDPAQDARVQQYVQMLQPAMWRELDFVRQVCDLAPEQRPKVKAAADAAVKEAAKAMLQPQRQARSMPTAAAQMIHDGVHEALKMILTSEQLENYSAEDASRTAATKHATISGVVSQLDGVLFLNAEQREKITVALDSNWQREWEQWLTMHQYAGQYFPQVPDQHVAPHLNADQKTVWSGLQKVMINAWHNGPRRQADDNWWDPDIAAKAKAKAAKLPAAKGKAALLQPAKKAK